MDKTNQIKEIIEKALPAGAIVHVMDPYKDGEHFQAIVVSESFEGMNLVKQHRAVMSPLKEAFYSEVHALALKTFTPQQWEEQKSNFAVV